MLKKERSNTKDACDVLEMNHVSCSKKYPMMYPIVVRFCHRMPHVDSL